MKTHRDSPSGELAHREAEIEAMPLKNTGACKCWCGRASELVVYPRFHGYEQNCVPQAWSAVAGVSYITLPEGTVD